MLNRLIWPMVSIWNASELFYCRYSVQFFYASYLVSGYDNWLANGFVFTLI